MGDKIGYIECWEEEYYPSSAEWADEDLEGSIICHFSPGHTEDSNLEWPDKIPHQDDAPILKVGIEELHIGGSKIEGIFQEGYDSSHHMWGQIYIGMDDVECEKKGDRVVCGRNPTQKITKEDFNGKYRR